MPATPADRKEEGIDDVPTVAPGKQSYRRTYWYNTVSRTNVLLVGGCAATGWCCYCWLVLAAAVAVAGKEFTDVEVYGRTCRGGGGMEP